MSFKEKTNFTMLFHLVKLPSEIGETHGKGRIDCKLHRMRGCLAFRSASNAPKKAPAALLFHFPGGFGACLQGG